MSASEQTSASKRDDEFFEAFRRLLWSYREIMSKHGYDLDRPSVSEAEAALSKFRGQPDELSKAQQRVKHLDYVVSQVSEGLRLACNVFECDKRVTAADRQIDFANRLIIWFKNECKGEMPKWLP